MRHIVNLLHVVSHHDREDDAGLLDHLEYTEDEEEEHLVERVAVDTEVGYATEIVVVGLVLVRDERECQTLDKLEGEEG